MGQYMYFKKLYIYITIITITLMKDTTQMLFSIAYHSLHTLGINEPI